MGSSVSPPPSPLEGLEELLRAARGGSGAALGRLLEIHRPYLLQVARAELRTPLRGKLGSSDMIQETFLEAQRVLARFRGESPGEFQGWLLGILRYKLPSQTRHFLGTDKRQADRELSLDAFERAADELAANQPSPSSVVNLADEATRVRLAMERLPAEYRQIIIWRQWDDLSFEEIAGRLSRSLDAARMVWCRAVKRLAQELNRQ